jgi:hypothetical protein
MKAHKCGMLRFELFPAGQYRLGMNDATGRYIIDMHTGQTVGKG